MVEATRIARIDIIRTEIFLEEDPLFSILA
jgi:hypothetical protein